MTYDDVRTRPGYLISRYFTKFLGNVIAKFLGWGTRLVDTRNGISPNSVNYQPSLRIEEDCKRRVIAGRLCESNSEVSPSHLRCRPQYGHLRCSKRVYWKSVWSEISANRICGERSSDWRVDRATRVYRVKREKTGVRDLASA